MFAQSGIVNKYKAGTLRRACSSAATSVAAAAAAAAAADVASGVSCGWFYAQRR